MTLSNVIKQLSIRAGDSNLPVRVLGGEVVSSAPLKIRLNKNDKLVLGGGRFVIPERLTDYTQIVQTPRGTEEHVIRNSLKNGDEIMLIALQGGGRYFVLDRI